MLELHDFTFSLRSNGNKALLAIPAVVNNHQRSYGNWQAFCNGRVSLSNFVSSVTYHCETETFEINGTAQ